MTSSSSPALLGSSVFIQKPLSCIKSQHPNPTNPTINTTTARATSFSLHRRCFFGVMLPTLLLPATSVWAASYEEYVKETEEVISKVRSTFSKDKNDPDIATAVADLRELSNSWVSKYRRDKDLLSRASFRDIYSALNAVSGHYVSFGPTAPIPATRKQRILEEVETAEKALKRGR